MIGQRRQMIYLPEINPNSFVFFFRKGDSGNSWSIRDYSVQNRASGPRYAHEFDFSLDDLWSKVVHHFDAPTHPSNDLNFWYRHTQELNRTYLGDRPGSITHIEPNLRASSRIDEEQREAFSIIDRDRFERHPKSRKPKDRERMLFSKTSEDWVTWTAFGLLQRDAPAKWWPDLVTIARASNPGLSLPAGWGGTPKIRLWESVPSPRGYERASRERMRRSNNPPWVTRSHNPKPVEGESEIDITLLNGVLVVFAEAKLGSDISLRTTYDPRRNQIVRNIDCVLDRAGNCTPMFWMLVRDAGQGRSYTQLLSHYQAHPEALVRELPHQDPDRVIALAGNLSLILWRDMVSPVVQVMLTDDPEVTSIKNELRLRIWH